MDFSLNDDQLAFQEAARSFADGELAPHTGRWDEDEEFPVDVIKAAGALGFCGIYAPEQWGGLGLGRLDTSIILEELSGGCTATAAYLSIHNMATWMLCRWGSDALRQEWATALTRGEKLASYCLTEPNAGSDAASLTTHAIKSDGDYILNGAKAFISGAGATDILIVMARTHAPDKGSSSSKANTVSAFAVPANTPGIAYGAKENKMGWRNQPTRSITFDNVRIPVQNLLDQEGQGFKLAMSGLDGGRVNIATCSIGTAQKAIALSKQYMHERSQFNKPLAEFQALQFKLADMTTELVAARQLVRLAAVKLDQNDHDKTSYCAMAKQFATDIGFKVCNEAMQLHGGYGYLKDYRVEQMVRDVRVHQILEGTNEIMRLIVARRILDTSLGELK